MAYVEVTIVTPNGEEYVAQVDEFADPDELLLGLVRDMELPLHTERGESIEYQLTLVGAIRIEEGATIRIDRKGRPPYLDLRRRGSQ